MRQVIRKYTIIIAFVFPFLVTGQATAVDFYDQFDTLDDVGIYMLMQDVDHHFSEARVDFEKKNFGSAAQEIRTATAFMELEATRTRQGDEQNALKKSIKELKNLSNDVEKGDVASGKTLHDAFAQAQFALSMNSLVKAKEAWNQQEFTKAFQELKASNHHLERALTWKGKGGLEKQEKTSPPQSK